MKISTATSVFVNYSIEEAIQLIAEIGYDGVDIWGGRPHVYRRDFTDGELKQLRCLLEDLGLSVPCFMPAFFRYPYSLVSPHDPVREDSIQYMRECADNAVALGARMLLIVIGHTLHGQTRMDAWQRLLDSIHRVCDYASQYDLKLALEPANRFVTDLVNTVQDAMRLVTEVGCSNLGVALDTGHIHLSDEKPEEAVERSGPHLFEVHINDNDGQQQQNLVPGEGSFDFRRFVQALRESGYDGFLTAELGWQYTLAPIPTARLALQRIREMAY